MDLKNAIFLNLGLLAMILLISSEVSARDLTEKGLVDEKTFNNGIFGHGGYYGNGYPGYGGYPRNSGGYNSGYGGGYPGNYGGYNGRFGSGYPGIDGGYNDGIGGYGGEDVDGQTKDDTHN
ncbi:unnamed protein product [Lathyrus sativus]|nr:unnamed protein product [Lathyrus sativus]